MNHIKLFLDIGHQLMELLIVKIILQLIQVVYGEKNLLRIVLKIKYVFVLMQ